MEMTMDVQEPITDRKLYTVQLIGIPKWGKTTFAVTDTTFLIDIERGAKNKQTRKFIPENWIDLKACCQWLLAQENPPVDTILFDGMDALVRMAMEYVCDKLRISHVADLANAKGYKILQDEILTLLLWMMNSPKYMVWLIGHTKCVTRRTHAGDRDFHQNTVMNSVTILINMYVDITVFGGFNEEGKRTLFCQSSSYYDAGGRLNMPEKLPYDRQIFDKELDRAILELQQTEQML